MDEKLSEFVECARTKGMDHATIRLLLSSAGWKDKEIAAGFCARDPELEIPEPDRVAVAPPEVRSVRPRASPWPRRARELFSHLLTYGSLYAWATSLILLFFTYVDLAFPDAASRISQAYLNRTWSLIRIQLAVLIVTFPIFLLAWNLLLRGVQRDPEKAGSAIRKWMVYLALFVGAITLAGDVIALVYFLLEGQLTVRLLLKSTVLLLIAGSLVLYLSLTLRSETRMEALR
ncbi:MAG: DUF5671 domain-containing protein [Planctomycetota bacterium]